MHAPRLTAVHCAAAKVLVFGGDERRSPLGLTDFLLSEQTHDTITKRYAEKRQSERVWARSGVVERRLILEVALGVAGPVLISRAN